MQLSTCGKEGCPHCHFPLKALLIMKLVTILIIVSGLQVSARTYAQKISLSHHNATLGEILNDIHEQTGYLFLYGSRVMKDIKGIDMSIKKATLEQALDQVLARCSARYPLGYLIENKTIIIFPKEKAREILDPSRVVEGIVKDNEGRALAGVTVRIKNSNIGTVTDQDGHFRVEIADNNTVLQFSFLGFERQEIVVGSQSILDINLQANASGLNEVVVVGYGTQKRSNLTGAVSTITDKQLSNRPITSGSQALQGLAPGVFVTQASGQPGADKARIRIRGVALNLGGGSSDPFVVVDGIAGSLDNINPNDIESITVLKDASAAAIYGARAANGVILVTTKRGKGKLTVAYDAYFGVTSPTDLPRQITNSATFMELANEMYKNSNAAAPFTQEDIDRYKTDRSLPNTNWIDLMFNNGQVQQHNISITSGENKTKFAFSGSYLHQLGNVEGFDYDRYNFRLNLDNEITRNIKVGANISGVRGINNGPLGDIGNIYTSTLVAEPNTAPYKSADGRFASASYAPGIRFVRSPFTWTDPQSGYTDAFTNRFAGNIFTDINIIEGLKLRGSAAYQIDLNQNRKFQRGWDTFRWSPDLTGDEPTEQTEFMPPQRNESSSEAYYRNLYATLDYTKTIAAVHQFHILVGANEEYFKDRGFSGLIKGGFPTPFTEFAQGSQDPANSTVDGSVSELVVRSYFGRFNYAYKDKYLLEANLRNDAVSNFSPENRNGYFPSVSVGWNISKENWFKLRNVEELKLRASWGRLGEYRGISDYAYLSLVPPVSGYSFGGTLVDGAATTVMPSESIVWQSNETLDFGLDAGLLSGKLNLQLDYFIKDNNDQLGSIPLVNLSGLNKPVGNPYSIRNQGWELGINYQNRDHKFKYSVGLNLTQVRNKVTDIDGLTILSGIFEYKEGLPAKMFRLYQVEGIFQSKDEVDAANAAAGGIYQVNTTGPGDLKYKDISGPDGKPDHKITDADRVVMGHPYPGYTYGLNLYAEYLGFDFSALLQGVSRYDVYMAGFGIEPLQDMIPGKFINRWTPENTHTNVYRLTRDVNPNNTSSSYPSDYYLQNGAYTRLKNIQLGYNFNMRKLSKIGIGALRVYINAQNPLTFTKLDDGFDPERLGATDPDGGSTAADAYAPQTIITTIGLNIKF